MRSIYSGQEFSPEELIREDFRVEQLRAEMVRERMARESSLTSETFAAAIDAAEAALPYNCEHVVPQSWFGKEEPMRGDLHHLFACEKDCNSFRGNIPYFDFADFEEVVREDCGRREGQRFEPGSDKGIVARATLYFLLRYPENLSNSYDTNALRTLLEWHRANPVGKYELHRNMAIYEVQGNRNPLIDHPVWADDIHFTVGLSLEKAPDVPDRFEYWGPGDYLLTRNWQVYDRTGPWTFTGQPVAETVTADPGSNECNLSFITRTAVTNNLGRFQDEYGKIPGTSPIPACSVVAQCVTSAWQTISIRNVDFQHVIQFTCTEASVHGR